MIEVKFNKVDNHYESDVIVADKNVMGLQIIWDVFGTTRLYRSINGEDWTYVEDIVNVTDVARRCYETNISVLVPEQKLKVIFVEGVVPNKIIVL